MIEFSVAEGLCTLRLNAPPLNTLSFALLEQLRAAVGRANADGGIRGIIITGGPQHFSAGADIGLFEQARSDEDAMRICRLFQEAVQEIEDSAKPVVAAVAGRVLGGALELAMACHFRVATEGSTFQLPEVNLGINPGSGGTQRLPRLIGLPRAIPMLVTGQTISSSQALQWGLVDAVCPPESLAETAARLLPAGTSPRKTRDRADKLADAAARQAAWDEAARLLKKIRPELIAPASIVAAVRTGVEESFQAGLIKEQEEFAKCLRSLAAQNKIYLFFATRKAGKVDRVRRGQESCPARATVSKAAVVGMGSMGTGIAQALLMAGLSVVVRDENEAALARGTEKIRQSLQKQAAQGKLSPQQSAHMQELLATTTQWEPLAEADVVIEAVYEDVAVKRAVLDQLETVCSPQTILASNTSTISLDLFAHSLRHPQRLLGLHFFNPAHWMPLVEVIPTAKTAPEVIAQTLQLTKRLRKTAVVVGNREGFLVTRLLLPYCKEAYWLLEEGVAAEAIDAAMVEFGFPMGPLTMIDMTGIDILAHSDAVLRRAFPRHGALPAVLEQLVAQGRLGQKTGGGVYDYHAGDPTPRPSRATAAILEAIRRESGHAARSIRGEEIARRLVLRMVNEAFFILEEGIAQRESDLDVAVVLGLRFPDFRGGVLKYAKDLGLGAVYDELQKLAAQCGERFSPCERLRTMKGTD